MSASQVMTGMASAAADLVAAMAAPFAGIVRVIRREAHIARAVRHLEGLNDDVLKDIGLHRSQIHAATRMGRADYARRYL